MIAVDNGFENAKLKSLLLNFQRFSRLHSGNRMTSMIEEALTNSTIKNKVQQNDSENLVNMCAASRTQFQFNENQKMVKKVKKQTTIL